LKGSRRVVVTGVGALTPIGNTAKGYWNNLLHGVSGSAPITRFNTSNFKTRFACEVKDFRADDYFDRKEARRLDPFLQYAVVAADEAVRDSQIVFSDHDCNRIGVIWGSGIGGVRTFIDEVTNFARGDGTPRFSPFFIPMMIMDIAPGYLSIKYGLRGPNFATVSACASSTNAIIDALNYIRLGVADVMITGGSEAIINEAGIGGFNALHALSTRNDSPATASRPFDLDRDGFVLGEGAGALILEELEHAISRGAHVYGELAGWGMSADAYHITAPHPDGLGAQLVMRNALEDAQIDASQIDYINVHGTSTPLGDSSEINAITSLFGESSYLLNISSTKSMTGHLLGAAGVIEAIASVMAVAENKVPPTINHFTDDPGIDSKINFTFNQYEEREINYALSNTFGFGGHNTSVIFKKYSG